eukprot:756888-Ditylum_brightwellii.AAC.1
MFFRDSCCEVLVDGEYAGQIDRDGCGVLRLGYFFVGEEWLNPNEANASPVFHWLDAVCPVHGK